MNIDLGKTQITDMIRVSSAAIFYEDENRFQFETFIFSDDKEVQKTRQIIHGSSFFKPRQQLVLKTMKIHDQIANNLIKKLAIGNA